MKFFFIFTFVVLPIQVLVSIGILHAGNGEAAQSVCVYRAWIESSDFTLPGIRNPDFHFYHVEADGFEEIIVISSVNSGYLQEGLLRDVFGPHESVEGFNRVVFECNDFLLLWAMRPVAKGYSFIVPRTGRKMIGGLSRNVEFPVRTFSCFLQGRFADGGIDFSRFLINTTLGVAGMFDVAKDWFDLQEKDEDFGQAFASWGCGQGCYLNLPIHGPTTLRDGIGLIFDYGFDPKTWVPIPGVQAFCKMNESSDMVGEYVRMARTCSDPYATVREFWYLAREAQISQ